MKTLKIWVLCLLLGTVWDVCLARDLKQNKDTTTKVASVDGPYVLYDETGRMRVIHVDEHGVLQDRVYDEVPEGFKLNVVSQKGGHRFQVKLHPV